MFRRTDLLARLRYYFAVASGCLALAMCWESGASADVIVLANRARETVRGRVQPAASQAVDFSLAPGEVLPVFLDGRANIEYSARGGSERYLLDANSAYYFGSLADGRVGLQKIGLGDESATAGGRTLPGRADTAPSAVIPVKILVDEEHPTREQVWRQQLKRRVDAASEILDRHCRIRLRIVAFETWNSENSNTEFFESLSEFEKEVDPSPGRLAIGFTSQYQVPSGRVHLAGTKGPFHSHILVREWARHVSEPERLELLVHELGHYLGASHSPERNSVMRPVLGDKLANRAGFRIQFDPVNSLIIGMVGEEVRRRNVYSFRRMSAGSKRRLTEIYGELGSTLPQDPAAGIFTRLVDSSVANPLVQGTKQVLGAIVRTARENRAAASAADAEAGSPTRLESDALTDALVQAAATEAARLPASIGPHAFLLGLGIGLDDSNVLVNHPKTKSFVKSVETPDERTERIKTLGRPTMKGRRDLAQHFVVSALLAAIVGSEEAEATGRLKELSDAQGGSGFSFADLAANKAGILFAGGVLRKHFTLASLAKGFRTDAYVPEMEGLPEGLSAAELLVAFGGGEDALFQRQMETIDRRIMQLPPYQAAVATDPSN